jgi:EmrB/QacA subfamily drug resistance transporter
MTTSPQTRRGQNRLAVLIALSLAAFIISLDVTIVNVVLPTLVRTLGATTTQLQWVVDAYSLVFAAFVLAAGSLSDRQGRKGTLLVGLAVFASGSLAGALVDTTTELIAARVVMGLGAALMFPSTLSLLVNVFTERGERAKAIGLWGATTGVGIAMGPIVGGWLLEHSWWGSIFGFMAGVAFVIGILVAWAVPTSRDPLTPPVDWRGFGLSSVALAVLILGVIEAPGWGWGSPAALSTMTAGVTLLALFVLFELRTNHPMLDVSLFRNPRFTAASASVAISFFALSGFIFLITQYFQFIRTFSPLGTGVRLLPVASAVALTSVVGTKLAVRIGNKAIVATGLLSFATGLLWTATVSASTSYTTIVFQMLFLGAGMGLTSAPATEAIMGAVPKDKAGVGSAVNDATRLFGGTLGVAVIGSIAASLYSSRLTSTAPAHLPVRAIAAARESVGSALIASHSMTKAGLIHAGSALANSASGAFLHSLAGGCVVAAGVVLAGALMAALFLPARPERAGLEKTISSDVGTQHVVPAQPLAIPLVPASGRASKLHERLNLPTLRKDTNTMTCTAQIDASFWS